MASSFAAATTDCISHSTENSAEQTGTAGIVAAWVAAVATAAAYFNWNFFAHDTWYADRYFVRNAYWNSLANFDRLLFANWDAYTVRNLLADGFAGPVANGIAAGSSFRNHGANSLANVLDSLLANPFAGSVANGSSFALRNHFASLVANGSLTAFWNHLASGVTNGTATWLAYVAANGVAHCLAVALRNHLAGCVANGSLTALWNHLANGVRNGFGHTASIVTNAVDFLGFASWNPALLADRSRWALNTLNAACTWAIHTSAA